GYNGFTDDPKGVVKIWDINSRKKECSHKCPFTCSVSCIDVSKNGNWVACGTTGIGNDLGDGSMWIWDIRSQSRTETICEEKDANVIAISPNDFYIALGGTSNSVYVFDTRQLNSILRVLRHENPNDGLPHDGVMSLQWVPGSNILISGGNDNCVKVWNIGDYKENRMIYQFTNHDSPVTSIRLSPDFKVMTVGVST
ncbi:5263_t:CDS:2, partial [Acaulospora morrowiae]